MSKIVEAVMVCMYVFMYVHVDMYACIGIFQYCYESLHYNVHLTCRPT